MHTSKTEKKKKNKNPQWLSSNKVGGTTQPTALTLSCGSIFAMRNIKVILCEVTIITLKTRIFIIAY